MSPDNWGSQTGGVGEKMNKIQTGFFFFLLGRKKFHLSTQCRLSRQIPIPNSSMQQQFSSQSHRQVCPEAEDLTECRVQ